MVKIGLSLTARTATLIPGRAGERVSSKTERILNEVSIEERVDAEYRAPSVEAMVSKNSVEQLERACGEI